MHPPAAGTQITVYCVHVRSDHGGIAGVANRHKIDKLFADELWEKHWAHHKTLLELMHVADDKAQVIRTRVREEYAKQRAALD